MPQVVIVCTERDNTVIYSHNPVSIVQRQSTESSEYTEVFNLFQSRAYQPSVSGLFEIRISCKYMHDGRILAVGRSSFQVPITRRSTIEQIGGLPLTRLVEYPSALTNKDTNQRHHQDGPPTGLDPTVSILHPTSCIDPRTNHCAGSSHPPNPHVIVQTRSDRT